MLSCFSRKRAAPADSASHCCSSSLTQARRGRGETLALLAERASAVENPRTRPLVCVGDRGSNRASMGASFLDSWLGGLAAGLAHRKD